LKRRAIIVDDEPDARARLRRLLAGHTDQIEIVGEAADGIAAVSALESLSPDLGFLDVEMPGLNGFQLLDSLPRASWPLIVFTTAYDQYAIRAFEVHALDYLLKPVTKERLGECLQRLELLSTELSRSRLDRARREDRPLERLLARSGAKHMIVQVQDVIAFEADDKLVFARTANGRFMLNVTLKELEERLDSEGFCRVHRQTIVQLRHARELHALAGGHYQLRLSDGSDVEVGRNFSRDFRARFG
jgi:two-component system, LytTR family, response regulator